MFKFILKSHLSVEQLVSGFISIMQIYLNNSAEATRVLLSLFLSKSCLFVLSIPARLFYSFMLHAADVLFEIAFEKKHESFSKLSRRFAVFSFALRHR